MAEPVTHNVTTDDPIVIVDDAPVVERPADVTGPDADRRQLQRLRRLVDDLDGVEPAQALPLILSAASVALGLDQMCVHIVEPAPEGGGPERIRPEENGRGHLRRIAALGVPEPFLSAIELVALGAEGGPLGLTAERQEMVVVDDVAAEEAWAHWHRTAAEAEIRSSWAVPICTDGRLLGVASGYATTIGRPPPQLLEVGGLYAGYAGSALERGRLLEESRALEAAQREAEALRRSQALQRDFLSRVSHELRTPLTAIHGYASSLLQPDVEWDGESRDRFLSAIASESRRMSRLVADLLDFSAIESGVFRLQPDWCRLPLVIAAALNCLPPGDAARVKVDCAPGLEPIWADHDRIEQVVVNLVENGLRHTPDGTQVRVTAQPGEQPHTVGLFVMDNGPGLTLEAAGRLFEPYVRGETRAGGAGLGLSIVRGIVEAHGGIVSIEPQHSLEGRGTTFAVVLPTGEAPSRG